MLGANCRFLQTPPSRLRRASRALGGDSDGEKEGAVERMRRAVEGNVEVQVEVVNYRKGGERFVNLVTIIPLRVGSERFNYSVGFMCEVEE